MAIDNKAHPSYFLGNFLSRPASAIPKGAQWAVQFENLQFGILPAVELAYSHEPGSRRWQTTKAAEVILSPDYQENKGCLFCQAIALPGEGLTPIAEGSIKSNAFLRSYVGAGRNDTPVMRMTFIDTNISFCDTFLRGWSLATANFGMIARSPSDDRNYRTNLNCYKFGITPSGPIILQTMTFEGICCVGVSEEEYNYETATSYVKREAQFVYHSYSVDSESGLPSEMKPASNNGG
jgi:hypothetical protein